jgi:Icc-related predicted phosphoesterase
VVLGDLVNLVDYRTMDGILVDVFGREMVSEVSRMRWSGDPDGAHRAWRAALKGREDEVRTRIRELMAAAYSEAAAALVGIDAYVTYGNVDDPRLMSRILSGDGARYVDGEVLAIDGLRVGIAGGGIGPEPGAPGIVTEDEMRAKLAGLGDVDVLCTHAAPAVDPLGYDVIAGSHKQSEAVLEFILEREPEWHYFGDVHQPQALAWRVGRTRCCNVGFFRATGRGVRHG